MVFHVEHFGAGGCFFVNVYNKLLGRPLQDFGHIWRIVYRVEIHYR